MVSRGDASPGPRVGAVPSLLLQELGLEQLHDGRVPLSRPRQRAAGPQEPVRLAAEPQAGDLHRRHDIDGKAGAGRDLVD